MAALTSEEVRTYRDDGYVVPSYRVPEGKMTVLSAAMEEVIAANAGTRPEQLPNVHITNGAGTHLKGHTAFLDVALDKDLLDLVSCVIGDDVVMWGCQIFCKPGSDGMEVPMHQDGPCASASRRGFLVARYRRAGCSRRPVRGREFRRDSRLGRGGEAASPTPERVR